MTLDGVRRLCRAHAGVTEDVKWGSNLVFSVGGRMFALVDLDPPHGIAFKCSPEDFAELVEREGLIPAPYLARAMWVKELELGLALGRRELTDLLAKAYHQVLDRLPRTRRPGSTARRRTPPARPARGRAPAKGRR